MPRSRRKWLAAGGIAAILVLGGAFLLVRPAGGSIEPDIVPIPPFAAAHGPPGGAAAHRAATALLATLDAAQAEQLVLPIDSPLRANWSNLPAGVTRFERNGLRLGDLTAPQAQAAFAFLGAVLGRHGYETVAQVVAAEGVMAESWLASRMGWSVGNYWLALFGEPTASGSWGWQFGGHHLAVNGSFADGRSAGLSPTFVGVEPSSFAFRGGDARPLAEEFADGLGVVRSLPAELRAQALLADGLDEVVAGPGRDGVVPEPAGGAVADWPEAARQRLLATIAHWVLLQPPESAEPRMAAIAEALAEMRFAWHGEIDGSGPVYFRVQGPRLILEFYADSGIDAADGHYHSMYRDPANEYGGDGYL